VIRAVTIWTAALCAALAPLHVRAGEGHEDFLADVEAFTHVPATLFRLDGAPPCQGQECEFLHRGRQWTFVVYDTTKEKFGIALPGLATSYRGDTELPQLLVTIDADASRWWRGPILRVKPGTRVSAVHSSKVKCPATASCSSTAYLVNSSIISARYSICYDRSGDAFVAPGQRLALDPVAVLKEAWRVQAETIPPDGQPVEHHYEAGPRLDALEFSTMVSGRLEGQVLYAVGLNMHRDPKLRHHVQGCVNTFYFLALDGLTDGFLKPFKQVERQRQRNRDALRAVTEPR
jgi:hypothetical protein